MSKFDNCHNTKCKSYNDEIYKDKALSSKLLKFIKENDIKKAEKIKIELSKNPKIKAYELCQYNSCKNSFYNFMKKKYDSFQFTIKLYNIKLNAHLVKLNNELGTLIIKKKLSEEEIIRLFIIYSILQKFLIRSIIHNPVMRFVLLTARCSFEKCTELYKLVKGDKDVLKLKVSSLLEKNEKKRNKYIEEWASHPKQVALDKCVAKHCNKFNFDLIKEGLKIYKKTIELKKIKFPLNIEEDINYLSSLKKLTEKDIPKAIIAFAKINGYINNKIKDQL